MDVKLRKNGVFTPKEAAAVRLAACGLSAKRSADKLHAARKTVENHLAHARMKAGVVNMAELVAYAFRHGVLASVLLVMVIFANGFVVNVQRPLRRPVSVVRIAMRRPVERLGSEFS